jgi:ribose/xylose/arabinose/galactoside ABC-type transport system permease subunit
MDRQRLQTFITLGVLLMMFVAFAGLSDRFLTSTNLRNVVRNMSPLIIASVAVTPVMIARGLDLSVGSVVAAVAVMSAQLAVNGTPLWLAFTLGVLLGTTFGLINGLIIVYLKVSPIIVTLGTLNIARGVAYLISSSAILVGLPPNWGVLGTTSIGPVPTPIIIAAIVFTLVYIMMARTVFGRHVYAIGGNEETARLSGVNVERTKLILYIISGTAAGLAGIVLASRVGSGDPNIGIGFEFQVIVAIILGGTSLAGGEGRVTGTLLGALIVGFLANGLNLAGIEPFWQYVAQGVVLIFAVVLDRLVNTGVLSITTQASTEATQLAPARNQTNGK